MSSRQQKAYGEEGQKLLCNSKIAIVGLENAGMETLKTAAMLGIGTIYLIDKSKKDAIFLDKKINAAERKAKQLEKIINDIGFKCGDLGKTVNIVAYEKKFIKNSMLIEKLMPDAIFDFTNNPSSQKQAVLYGIQFAKKKKIEIYIGCCNNKETELKPYFPNPEDNADYIMKNIKIPGLSENQDLALSHLLSGIAIEYFRKNLFIKNKDKLGKIAISESKHKIIEDHLFYSLATRNAREKTDLKINMQEDFAGKKFLLCGCGAIANPLADMLVKYKAGRIDCIDYDIIADHNIERQPLYYDKIGMLKAQVLCDKLKSIADQMGNSIKATPLIGKIGEEGEYDHSWFNNNANVYDIIFGCFDDAIPRDVMNKFCKEMKFNYIDGGSETRKATVVTYIPGKTSCLNCNLGINSFAQQRKEEERKNEEYMRLNISCVNPEITPNVNMSNRIAAALMMGEARTVISPDSSEPFKGRIFYTNSGYVFGAKDNKGCSFCQKDHD